MTEGIDIQLGKTGADFSYHNGFYLSADLDFALKWLEIKPYNPKTKALIIFGVQNSGEIFPEGDGKRFEDAGDEWKSCITRYRNLEKGFGWRKREQNLKYIYGPLSKDGNKAKRLYWKPWPREPLAFQLCIKDDILSEIFYWASDIFVIFFN